jgi:hypothetical protein
MRLFSGEWLTLQELIGLEPKSAEGSKAAAPPEGGRYNNREKHTIELDSL